MKKLLFILFNVFPVIISQAQWINIGTVTGTGANYPSVSVVNENAVWVSGGNSGTPVIWRSTNNGSSFSQVNPPPCFEITCIKGISADECFTGDGGSSGAVGGNAKLYRTTNAGVNWTLINQTGGTNGFFNDIVFSKTNPTDGTAISNPPAGSNQPYYVLKTTDGGNNWIVQNPPAVTGSNGVWHCVFIYDASAYGFSITGGFLPRLYGTTTGGSSWQALPVLISGNPVTSFAFSDINQIALAGTSSVVARTTDQGLSWQTVNSGGALCIRWIPGTNICYFMSGSVIKKSTDEGASWNTMTSSGVTGLKHFDFAVSGNNVYGYGITGNGTVIRLSESLTGVKQTGNELPGNYYLGQNYPNPFNPVTSFELRITGLSHVRVTLYDAIGRETQTIVNDEMKPGIYEVTFNASNLPSGVYYYKLTAFQAGSSTGGFTDTKKMVVVK